MKLDFLTLPDIIIGFFWLVILLTIAHIHASKNALKEHYKYYLRNIYFKLFLGLSFACFYVFYYGGGDTTAYWEGACAMNNLFFKSPTLFFEELFSTTKNINQTFNITTGYPPGWIYREPEGWFVSKIATFLTFITFKSYWAATFIVSFILAKASWKVFELVRSYAIHKESQLAFGVLFIPSVSFWCGGISKDSLVLISIFYLIYHLFQIISIDKTSSWKNWLGAIICSYLILETRSVILIAIFVPIVFSYSVRLKKKYLDNLFLSLITRGGIILIGIGSFLFVIQSQSAVLEGYIEEASVVQQDFLNNKTYGDKRYDLGITDYSMAGMVKVFPQAIYAGTFRPAIWESFSPTLILNGIESLIMMYLTILFVIKGNFIRKIRQIFNNEVLIFALFFVLLMGFMAGFTAVLFGVLVRFKASVLPFLVLLLTAHYAEEEKEQLTVDN
jgi:hypothetical protein